MGSEYVFFYLLLLCFFLSKAQTIDIAVRPSDACVCSGEPVQFNCTATTQRTTIGGEEIAVIQPQLWEVDKVSEPAIVLDSGDVASIPAVYEFVFAASGQPTGLRVLSTDLSFNQTTFMCTGYDEFDNSVQQSAPSVTLEVAGLSEFSCDVSCVSPYSSTDDSCNVTWTRPTAGSCSTLTGFIVSVTDDRNTAVSSGSTDLLNFITGALEPSQGYTATITIMNSCGNKKECSRPFTTPAEEKPAEFSITLVLVDTENIIVSLQFTDQDHPRVAYYTVAIDKSPFGGMFPGDSSALSLDTSSLQQCMNYTVSVTATNTGGNRTANATLTLDFDTSVDVFCSAGEDGCYLEAVCAADQPGLAGGCSLTYSSDGGSSQPVILSSGELTLRVPVSCDNQTISAVVQVLTQTMTPLGCALSRMTTCPYGKNCEALLITNGTVTYSTTGNLTGGTVATYSCNDGYELVGEKMRACLVDGSWTGGLDNPVCQDTGFCDSGSPWFGLSIALLLCFVLSVIVIVAMTLKMIIDKKKSGGQTVKSCSVELSENVCYGPVAPPQSGATQTVEYEEIGAPTTTTTAKTPTEKLQ